MSYCVQCGYEYVEGVSECPDCGIHLTAGDPAFCPECQEQILHVVKTCPHCGVLLGWQAEKDEELQCVIHREEAALGECVVCKTAMCAQCARRRNGRMLCKEHYDLKVASDWVSVYSASTLVEAHLMKASLEAAHIPALLLSQHDRMYTTTVGDLAVTEVMVPTDEFEAARKYIHDLETERGSGESTSS